MIRAANKIQNMILNRKGSCKWGPKLPRVTARISKERQGTEEKPQFKKKKGKKSIAFLETGVNTKMQQDISSFQNSW